MTPWFRVALWFVAAMAVACGGSTRRDDDEHAPQAPQRVQADGSIKLSEADQRVLGLTLSPATDEELPDSVVRLGVVITPPGNDAPILAPVTGRIAQPPRVRLGAAVRAGDTIAEVVPVLDTPDRLTIGTQSAERDGQIEAARREMTKAEADLERARALTPQVVSAAKLQEAETAAAQARARLDASQQARTVSSTVQTQPVPIRAVMAGTVVALTMNVGTSVKAGDLVGRLLRRGAVWIDVGVPPDEPVGDRYEILASARDLPARLLARGGITEADGTRHDRLVVELRDPVGLTPGASVSVRVARGTSRGVVIPESSIVPGIDSDLVFVETAPLTFVSRPIHVDARYGGRVRVARGIRPGEKVVVQGAMALYGERVRAQLQPS